MERHSVLDHEVTVALHARLATLPGRASVDGEWRLVARHLNARVRLQDWDVVVVEGVVAGVGPADATSVPEITITAPPEVWDGMLAAVPPPFLHDLWSAHRHGLRMAGDPLLSAQYGPALVRLLGLLRDDRAKAPAADPRRTRTFDRAIGRYVHLQIDGTAYRVYFDESGVPEGVPLLLQHTAGGDGRQWRHVLEDEVLAGVFHMIAYDLPFHGRSLPPTNRAWWAEEYRLTRSFLVAFPLALIDVLDLDRPVFMGSSIGGHLAVDLALDHPDRFRAVVGLEAALKQTELDLTMLDHPGVSGAYKAAVMRGLTSPTSPEANRREVDWVYSQGAPSVFRGDLHYWQTDHDLRSKAAAIDTERCPVHLLTGEYDSATPPTLTAALAAQIPGSSFAVLEGMGHFPMTEDPGRFLDIVRPLLLRCVGNEA